MAGKGAGIYSPALRTRGVGTYRAPSAGQHKAMLKAEGIKYKGLTDKQIIAKAKKSGDLHKQTKKPKMSTTEKVAIGAGAGVVAEKELGLVDKASKAVDKVIHKTKKILKPKDKYRTKTLPKIISDLKASGSRGKYPKE